MDYAERKQLKQIAWKRYELAETVEQKVSAMELIIFAHYERSKETYGKGHPLLFEFSCHWVYASRPDWFRDDLELRAALMAKYPIPALLSIAAGHAYWKNMNDDNPDSKI